MSAHVTTTPTTKDRTEPRVRRDVVSFVRRSARMRPNQQHSWEILRDRYLVPVRRGETSTSVHPRASLDPAAAFGRSAPLVVEVGPGTGESLVSMAMARPDANVLAFEVYTPALAQILARLEALGVENVRLVEADAAAGLRRLLGAGSVEELWTFFPDPWHKARHRKRRLVNAEFAALVASRLRVGGRWRLATDWGDYAAQMRAVLTAEPDLVSVEGDVHGGGADAPRLAERPVTRFEQRGIDAGRTIVDLCYRRV